MVGWHTNSRCLISEPTLLTTSLDSLGSRPFLSFPNTDFFLDIYYKFLSGFIWACVHVHAHKHVHVCVFLSQINKLFKIKSIFNSIIQVEKFSLISIQFSKELIFFLLFLRRFGFPRSQTISSSSEIAISTVLHSDELDCFTF